MDRLLAAEPSADVGGSFICPASRVCIHCWDHVAGWFLETLRAQAGGDHLGRRLDEDV